jgi:PAS domain S-box-containing protein
MLAWLIVAATVNGLLIFHFIQLNLLGAVAVSLAIFYVRLRTRRDMESLHLDAQAKTRELQVMVQEQQRAEEELRRERDFAQQVLNTMGQGLIVTDSTGKVEYANPAIARMLGYAADELVGKYSADITLESESATLAQAREHRRKGEITTYEVGLRNAQQETIPVVATGVPRGNANEYRGAIVVLTDLSAQKQMEQQLAHARDQALEAARVKSEFLATMSHEIRTPLNSIIGMTELLLDSALRPEQRELARTARESADALLAIINNILDLSKIEAGKIELEQIPFDVREIVDGAIEIAKAAAPPHPVHLESEIGSDVPSAVLGDAGRVRQTLLNLLSNAYKFAARGSIQVRVERIPDDAAQPAEGYATLRFIVRDTGIGMSEHVQANLFEPFSQADGTINRRYGGTGLGLAISKRLVEMMGGEIHVSSTEGVGSTFWFQLRLPIVQAPVADETQATSAPLAERYAGLILLAEDNAANQKLTQLQLQKLGCAAQTVGNGSEAVLAVQEFAAAGKSYDLVLMDCQMPEMDGFEATRAIRAFEQAHGAHVPIVAMTANALQGDREKCIQAGMDDYLTKPVVMGALRTILARWLGAADSKMEAAPILAAPALDFIVSARNSDSASEKHAPSLDLSVLHSMRTIEFPESECAVTEIFATFFDAARAQLSELNTCIEQHDRAQLRRIAHSLRGSASSLGARRLAQMAHDLEMQTDARPLDASMVTELQAELDKVQAIVDEQFKAFVAR